MKFALIAAMIILGLVAACSSSSDNAVHVTEARAPGSTCTFSDSTIYKERGSLDLSAFSVVGQIGYSQIFSWENTLAPRVTTVNGDILTDLSQATFYAKQAVLTYSSSDSNVSLPGAAWDMSASIAGGAQATSNSVAIELLPGAIPALLDKQVTTGMTPVTLDVKMHLEGEVAGQKSVTAALTFPLTIYKSGTTKCSPPFYVTGECGVLGKDLPVICAPNQDAGTYFP